MNLRIKKKKVMMTAPMWRRAVAFLIDYLIIASFIIFPFDNLVNKVVSNIGFFDMMTNLALSGAELRLVMYASAFASLMAVLYFAILESKFNQSIGKMVMKINVVTIDRFNRKKVFVAVNFWKSIVRALFLFAFPLVFLIDGGYMFSNPERQRLLEKISMTKTVYITEI